jgi:hypothetical protein
MVLMREAYCRRVSYFQPGPAGRAAHLGRPQVVTKGTETGS